MRSRRVTETKDKHRDLLQSQSGKLSNGLEENWKDAERTECERGQRKIKELSCKQGETQDQVGPQGLRKGRLLERRCLIASYLSWLHVTTMKYLRQLIQKEKKVYFTHNVRGSEAQCLHWLSSGEGSSGGMLLGGKWTEPEWREREKKGEAH